MRTSGHSSGLDGLFNFLLVLPAEIREAADVCGGLGCCPLPEAGEVVPVGDLPVKHGRLGTRGETGASFIFVIKLRFFLSSLQIFL